MLTTMPFMAKKKSAADARKDRHKKRYMVGITPPPVAAALRDAAAAEYCEGSDLVRRILVAWLKEKGFLPKEYKSCNGSSRPSSSSS